MCQKLLNAHSYKFLATWTHRVYLNPLLFTQPLRKAGQKITFKESSTDSDRTLASMYINDELVTDRMTCWHKDGVLHTFAWEFAFAIIASQEPAARTMQDMLIKKLLQ